MSPTKQLVSYTEQLIKVLDEPNASVDREETIQKVHILLEKRAQIIEGNSISISENEKRVRKELLRLNKHAQQKLAQFFEQLKKDMRTSQMQRKSNRSYIRPYRHVQLSDGMYVDQKK